MKKPNIYLLLFILPILLFLIALVKLKSTSEIDLNLTSSFYNFLNNSFITSVFSFISNYTIGTIFGAGVVTAILIVLRKYFISIVFVIFGGLSFVSVEILKQIVGRVRPFLSTPDILNLSGKLTHELSFPSGHATLSFFIAYFLVSTIRMRMIFKVLIYTLAFAVAFSRIYLGVHYVLDVIAGVILGLSLGIMAEYFVMKTKNLNFLSSLREKSD